MEWLVNTGHELLWTLLGLAGTYFLGGGVIRGMKHHWKFGTGAAMSAIGGGIAVAVVVAHIVGIYQRGNQEFDKKFPTVGHSHYVDRGW